MKKLISILLVILIMLPLFAQTYVYASNDDGWSLKNTIDSLSEVALIIFVCVILFFIGCGIYYGVCFIIFIVRSIKNFCSKDKKSTLNSSRTYYSGKTYSGGGYYSDKTYSSASNNQSYASSDTNGFLYEGRYTTGLVTATYRDGQIFDGYNSGLNFSRIKATYQNGFVYEGSITGYMGKVIGRYESGSIYRGNSTFNSDRIGRYENGNIYKGSSTFSCDIIGKYTGDDDGGAAAAIVYLFN